MVTITAWERSNIETHNITHWLGPKWCIRKAVEIPAIMETQQGNVAIMVFPIAPRMQLKLEAYAKYGIQLLSVSGS